MTAQYGADVLAGLLVEYGTTNVVFRCVGCSRVQQLQVKPKMNFVIRCYLFIYRRHAIGHGLGLGSHTQHSSTLRHESSGKFMPFPWREMSLASPGCHYARRSPVRGRPAIHTIVDKLRSILSLWLAPMDMRALVGLNVKQARL